MNIQVKELVYRNPRDRYPYTHRVGIADLRDWEKVHDWIMKNEISCSAINSAQCFYLNKENTVWLLTRWS